MICLEPNVLADLRRHGEAAYPEECCGVLLGRVHPGIRTVTEAVALANGAADGRERRFRIEARDYRQSEGLAAARGLVLVGFYHSHPEHPARPSAYDLEHAVPWHSYVILAVTAAGAGEWSSWILAEDRSRFEPEAVVEAVPTGEV